LSYFSGLLAGIVTFLTNSREVTYMYNSLDVIDISPKGLANDSGIDSSISFLSSSSIF
jgi:hypothetical protein